VVVRPEGGELEIDSNDEGGRKLLELCSHFPKLKKKKTIAVSQLNK
jgi:hypothetical protein